MQLDWVKEKSRNTCLKKYGVEYSMQSEIVKQKAIETYIKNYGVPNPYLCPEVRAKINQTNLKRYGTIYPMQNDSIKRKQRQTCFERYGFYSSSLNDNIAAKIRKTMYENGTCRTSQMQQRICDVIGGKLNYPEGKYSIDILYRDNIAIEYDGSGHNLNVRLGNMTQEEHQEKEDRRDKYLLEKGYKIIRIINVNDKEMSDQEISEIVAKCIDDCVENNEIKYYV